MRGTRARRAHTSKLVTTNVDAVSVTSMPASWPDASNMWRSTKRTNRVSIGGQARVLATSRVCGRHQNKSPVRPHENLFVNLNRRDAVSTLAEARKVHHRDYLAWCVCVHVDGA